MRAIKLHFVDSNHLTMLLNDASFLREIQYLTHFKIDANNIVLLDPITQHDNLETEMVVLSKFAIAIKRVIFSNTNHEVEFLSSNLRKQKGGLVHDNLKIIDSTDVQL